jgi:hypothetical protein
MEEIDARVYKPKTLKEPSQLHIASPPLSLFLMVSDVIRPLVCEARHVTVLNLLPIFR